MSDFILFEESKPKIGKITKVWNIKNKQNGIYLGVIAYHPG